jgi:hypothetical protein
MVRIRLDKPQVYLYSVSSLIRRRIMMNLVQFLAKRIINHYKKKGRPEYYVFPKSFLWDGGKSTGELINIIDDESGVSIGVNVEITDYKSFSYGYIWMQEFHQFDLTKKLLDATDYQKKIMDTVMIKYPVITGPEEYVWIIGKPRYMKGKPDYMLKERAA